MSQHATRRFPAEWEPHERTIMSWPSARIWEEDARYVRKDIARLARVLAESEPVMLLASPDDVERAARACGPNVEVVPIPVDHLWARDTVPVCVDTVEGVLGVDLNFTGWGGKQSHVHDAAVAERFLDVLSIPRTQARIVAEGGSLESDGAGTLLVTESSVVNPNRNPGRTRDELEAELRALLGVSRVVWFDGVVGADITDAHVDSLARFTAPGVVLLDVAAPGAPKDVWSRSAEQARGVLSRERDARGAAFEVVDLPQPDLTRIRANSDEFLASYVNFFVGNEVVLVPEFGDGRADRRARAILSEHFPSRVVVAVRIDEIAAGGGGIHCATREVPSRSSVSGM